AQVIPETGSWRRDTVRTGGIAHSTPSGYERRSDERARDAPQPDDDHGDRDEVVQRLRLDAVPALARDRDALLALGEEERAHADERDPEDQVEDHGRILAHLTAEARRGGRARSPRPRHRAALRRPPRAAPAAR